MNRKQKLHQVFISMLLRYILPTVYILMAVIVLVLEISNYSNISSNSSVLSFLADYKALCPGGTGTATNGTMITGTHSTFIATVSSGLESLILSSSTNA